MDTNQSIVLFCAFRYALGRSTYVVSAVVQEIHRNWNLLADRDKELFVREITEKQNLGMECDEKDWISIIERFNNEKRTPGDPMFGGLMKE